MLPFCAKMALGPGWTGSCCSYWQSFISLAAYTLVVTTVSE